ncbi:MAG: VOC family protein [Acidimicrobiales bacterium]
MTDFYHVCFAVPDLEAAMGDLDAVAGIEWSPPQADTLGGWSYRIVFSRTVPHIELMEGPSGSPWDATGGAHFHHLGWWTHSLTGSTRQLAEAGLPSGFDGCPYGRSFAYHRMDSIGARIEIVDVAAQPAFLQTWNPGGEPMPALGDPEGPRP